MESIANAHMSRRAFLAGALLASAACGAKALPSPALADEGLSTGYYDVDASAWYFTEGWITYVTQAGIMTGTKDAGGFTGNFEPEAPITRGQVVTVLYRYANPGATDTSNAEEYRASTHFTDAAYPYYYNAAIAWAEVQGITTGYRNGSYDTGMFGPNDAVTREQLATMLARFARSLGGADTSSYDASAFWAFSDASSASGYAIDSLAWCVACGIMSGDAGAGTLRPQGTATRAEFAKMITVLTRDVLGGVASGTSPWYVSLGVEYVNQMDEGMPMGCEGASLYMGMRYKGYLQGYSYLDFMATMPISPDNNPNNGFSGDPAVYDPSVYSGIYAAPLATWGSWFGSVADISGSSQWELVEELLAGNPVVVFVTLDFQEPTWGQWPFGWAVDNAHIMTLIGYDPSTDRLQVADPYRSVYWVDWWTFYRGYSATRGAVAVR